VEGQHKIPGRAAIHKIAAALRARHFRVEHGAAEWAVSVDTDAGSPECSPLDLGPPAPDEVAANAALKGIRRLSETEYALTRGELEALLEGQTVFRGARLVDEYEGGKMVGVRLVRSGDAFERVGLRVDDRLIRVAGYDLRKPDEATALRGAFSSVAQTAKRIEVVVERRGADAGWARVTLVYRVK
jgi:hypothetical protein